MRDAGTENERDGDAVNTTHKRERQNSNLAQLAHSFASAVPLVPVWHRGPTRPHEAQRRLHDRLPRRRVRVDAPRHSGEADLASTCSRLAPFAKRLP